MSASTALVLASLALATALVVAARVKGGAGPAGIDFPQWDFSESWASNLTVVGAILGTVLSANVLPPKKTVVMAPDGYTALSLLFGILVVLAPFLYTAFRKGRPRPTGPEYRGRNGAFLVASALTVWATCGQIATVGLVLYEAQHAKVLAPGAVIPMLAALGVALVLTCIYSLQSIRLVLESEARRVGARADDLRGRQASGAQWKLL